jgi:hypothetical protein
MYPVRSKREAVRLVGFPPSLRVQLISISINPNHPNHPNKTLCKRLQARVKKVKSDDRLDEPRELQKAPNEDVFGLQRESGGEVRGEALRRCHNV